MTRVSDGEFTYMAKVGDMGHSAAKMKSGPGDLTQWGGKRFLDNLRENFALTLEVDEKISERPAYLILARSKTTGGWSRHWFDREYGVMVKMTIYGENGPERVFTLDEIAVNVDFPEDHFTFVPPEGVEIEDLTDEVP